MADKFEYYNTGDDHTDGFWGSNWWAQTFTPSIKHTITSVKLKLMRVGSPSTITVSIRATDEDGHPTGEDLCSGTTEGNTLTTDYEGEWREITLGDGTVLSADTKYAIVVRALSGDGSNYGGWRLNNGAGTYSGGNEEASINGGVNWISQTLGEDLMFEEWGEYILGRQLTVKVITTQHHIIKPITTQHHTIKTITTQYRKVSPITTLYRKIRAITTGG